MDFPSGHIHDDEQFFVLINPIKRHDFFVCFDGLEAAISQSRAAFAQSDGFFVEIKDAVWVLFLFGEVDFRVVRIDFHPCLIAFGETGILGVIPLERGAGMIAREIAQKLVFDSLWQMVFAHEPISPEIDRVFAVIDAEFRQVDHSDLFAVINKRRASLRQ